MQLMTTAPSTLVVIPSPDRRYHYNILVLLNILIEVLLKKFTGFVRPLTNEGLMFTLFFANDTNKPF